MKKTELTFALYFGNRGFFPGELIADARAELQAAVTRAGHRYICMEESLTRYGAVETMMEGEAYAAFLAEYRGKYDGIILCLPNFGDENGAQVALADVNVPILVQAYPDEIGKMDFAHRRDAMCGKFAMCHVLRQMGLPYTLTSQFVISPADPAFGAELSRFASLCRVVKGMKRFSIGAIGARTTAFKTVRVDETALEKKGITVESLDLADVFARMEQVSAEQIAAARDEILAITTFSGFPAEKLDTMAATVVAFRDIVKEYRLSAVAVRCWNEFETRFGIAPCVALCLLNEVGISAACEVDVPNAVMMRALSLASDSPCMLLDFNNNYGEEKDAAVLFHCGPVPPSMLEGKGEIVEHLMFKKSFGPGTGVGVNRGKIKSGDITFGSVKTEDGRVCAFVCEGTFTDDPIEEAFFGTGKVVRKDNINDVSNFMGTEGYKHHLSITYGQYADVIREAFEKYLGYDIVVM